MNTENHHRSSSEQTQQALATFPVLELFLALVGLALTCWGYELVSDQYKYRLYQPSQATVTSSITRPFPDYRGTRRKYYGRTTDITYVKFEYSEGNQLFQQEMQLKPKWSNLSWGSQCSWTSCTWRVGRRFSVFVNPSNPKDWTLTQGPSPEAYATLAGGILLLLTSALLFYPSLYLMFSDSATG